MTIKGFENIVLSYRMKGLDGMNTMKRITPRAYNAFVREHKEYAERRGLELVEI